MMKYILTAAMILAAPMAFAQVIETTIQSGGESSHSETRDTTSTTNGAVLSTHDEIQSHQATDTTPNAVVPEAGGTTSSSTTIDQTHIDGHGAVHDTTTQDTQSDND
jgi:hypothetical protein